jgi:hypothetical protein
MTASLVYGVLAEFDDTDALIAASQSLHERGYRRMDAHTPFPVDGLADALGFTKTRLPLVVLVGAIVGGTLGFGLQYWAAIIAYPLNVGGRPISIETWLSFVPVTFELTILGGALSAVLGMLGLNGLPRPHHPLFAVEGFRMGEGYFLSIEARDDQFDLEKTRKLLLDLKAKKVWDVPLSW